MLRAYKLMAATGVLITLVACGGSKAATKATAGVARTVTPPATHIPKVASSSTVRISSDVRKACGVQGDDAYFAFDSYQLRSQDTGLLNTLAHCFSSGPLASKTMKLVGRADPRGNASYNMTLGDQRADAVARYVERHGLARAQVQTTSRGAADDTGTGDAAWQNDRRVDILVGS